MRYVKSFPNDSSHLSISRDGAEEHYWVAPLFGPLLGGLLAALIYTFVIAAHLKDSQPELEEYVPNRFRVQPQSYSVTNEYHQNHGQQYAPASQKGYTPQPPPPIPYRSGH